MGQTLTNNIYLPDEGERNCYAGLAANWRALDAHLGNTDIHVTYADKQAWNDHVADSVKHVTAEDKQAWNGHVADTTIHVTSADKSKWNTVTSKADASALTAHTGDTTIHVTAEDKQAWNGKQDALSQTQLDAVNSGIDSTKVQQIATNTSDISSLQSVKANDSDVVHNSGNETVGGQKTFTNTIKSKKEIELTGNRLAYILPESSASYSGLSLCTYSSNGAVKIGSWKVDDNDNTKHVLDSSLGYLSVSTGAINSVNIVYLTPKNSTNSKLGDSTNKWHEINGLEPSSLSLPSGNVSDVIDISSYITGLSGNVNTYTAPANGWISIAVVGTAIAIVSSSWSDSRLRASSGNVRMLYPVLKNETVSISIAGNTLAYARFIPCQGNV